MVDFKRFDQFVSKVDLAPLTQLHSDDTKGTPGDIEKLYKLESSSALTRNALCRGVHLVGIVQRQVNHSPLGLEGTRR